MSYQILVVDDDERIIRAITRFFENFEFKVRGASTFKEAIKSIDDNTPDLVLLDLALPDGHGFEIAQKIRASHDSGVIIISGSNEQIDKVVGLEIGADDYLNKPFELRELLARTRSVLRRTNLEPDPVATSSSQNEAKHVRFDGWNCDFEKFIVTSPDGREATLTGQEMKLLEILVRANGRVLSRDKLMDLMKGKDWVPLDRSIDVLVGKIRKKMRALDPKFTNIATLRGEGYKFIGKATWS